MPSAWPTTTWTAVPDESHRGHARQIFRLPSDAPAGDRACRRESFNLERGGRDTNVAWRRTPRDRDSRTTARARRPSSSPSRPGQNALEPALPRRSSPVGDGPRPAHLQARAAGEALLAACPRPRSRRRTAGVRRLVGWRRIPAAPPDVRGARAARARAEVDHSNARATTHDAPPARPPRPPPPVTTARRSACSRWCAPGSTPTLATFGAPPAAAAPAAAACSANVGSAARTSSTKRARLRVKVDAAMFASPRPRADEMVLRCSAIVPVGLRRLRCTRA